MTAIRKLLVANRGEIACRLIRTAKRMGLRTVAVHSDADAAARHVVMADEAIRIGGNRSGESYLDGDAIVAAARRCEADAVHPGYGFLSENSAFAEACLRAGLIFVGPPPAAIRAMGDKRRAKALMDTAGVPVVPGYAGADQSYEAMALAAEAVGYPLLIKAAAGGGGRGMRKVESAEELGAALESAAREAESAFGDPTVLLERLIVDGRHVEIQVFADSHGNCIHLGERDCSAQRRHQKVIEEAPSPFVDAKLRAAMGADAVKAACAIGYRGAGTVEFIVGADRRYHFLEMNTRLQVEHPVTEMITGFDLVEWQLRVAGGEPIPVRQEEAAFRGHAIEARLYAEDPYQGFRPQTGKILFWRPGDAGHIEGVRIDDGIQEGDVVGPYYDPMLAKIIAHGKDRQEAIARLRHALLRTPLIGPATNRTFLLDLTATPEFIEGGMTTDLIDRWADEDAPILSQPGRTDQDFALAATAIALAPGGDWFRSSGVAEHPLSLVCNAERREIALRFERGKLTSVVMHGASLPVAEVELILPDVRYTIDGVARHALMVWDGEDVIIDIDGRTLRFSEPDPLAADNNMADPSKVTSPVAGLVRSVAVALGETVVVGQPLVVVEAMKMETTLAARGAGVVHGVHIRAGEQTRVGDVLMEISPQKTGRS
ncbi:MAG TPA: biotin carboxylase N-terminal domain-containing protein [Rhizobiaceae bacterium]|nr:biotin carboxylase N-terminal domain-containing protein [Rhizobiaceae bacterium]